MCANHQKCKRVCACRHRVVVVGGGVGVVGVGMVGRERREGGKCTAHGMQPQAWVGR